MKEETNKKNISLLSDWRPLLLSVGIIAVLVFVGAALLPKRDDSLYQILWIGCFVLLGLCYLANFIFTRRINFLFNKRKLSDVQEDVLKRQRSVEADYQQAQKRLNRAFWFARLWYSLTVLLVCSAALLTLPASVPFYISLMNCYLLWGLLCVWFPEKEQQPAPLTLPEAEYPVLYDLIHRAARTAGCQMPVRVYAGGGSVGILRKPKEIWILVDAVTCALYTKQELYNVLLHEFAHEFNEDTVRSMRVGREMQYWNNLPEEVLPKIGGYLLQLPAGLTALEATYYDLFASRHKEELADACAARWGDPQILVNSLAKLSVWSFYEYDTPVPGLLLYSDYAGEKPREDLPAHALRTYYQMLPQWREKWRHRLDVELPPRISSHPIFRQRREAFGVTDYSFEDVETDPAYLAETEAMLDLTGKAIAEQMAKTYEEDRKHCYFARKELIDRAKTVTDWSACSIDDRIEMAKALAVLEPKLEEAVIQSIRREDPENAYGLMLLGVKRFRENDPECVELLFQAAKANDNFVEEAYQRIADYALRNGDQELLDRYRSEVTEAVQEVQDGYESRLLRWNGRDCLSENDLPESRFEANRKAILERTEGKLSHLYTAKKPISVGFCYYYFLEFPRELPVEEHRRLYGQVFLYLDYCEEQYFLEDLTDRPKQREMLLKQVPGCELSRNSEGENS